MCATGTHKRVCVCVVVEGTSKINKNSLVKMGPFHDSGVGANGYAMEKVIKKKEEEERTDSC